MSVYMLVAKNIHQGLYELGLVNLATTTRRLIPYTICLFYFWLRILYYSHKVGQPEKEVWYAPSGIHTLSYLSPREKSLDS